MPTKPEINIKVTADTAQARSVLGELGNDAKRMGNDFEEGAKKVKVSLTDVVTHTTNLANSFFTLYKTYDMVNDRQLALDRANLRLSQSQDALRIAQEKYNEAVAKFGPSSQEAQIAYKDLQDAIERVRINQEAARDRQDDLNQAYFIAATTAIPQLIVAIGNLRVAYQSLAAAATAANVAVAGLGVGGVALAAGVAGAGAIGLGEVLARITGRRELSLIEIVRAQIEKIVQGDILGGLFGPAWPGGKPPERTILDDIVQGLLSGFNSIAGGLSNLAGSWSQTWEDMSNSAIRVADSIRNYVNDLINSIMQSFSSLNIADVWASIWNSLYSTVANVTSSISGIIWGWINELQNAISSLLGSFSGLFDFEGGEGYTSPYVIPGFAEGALVTKPTIALVGEKGPELIVPIDPHRQVGFFDLGGVWDTVTSGFNWIVNSISSTISNVTSWISSGIEWVTGGIQNVVSGVTSGVTQFFGGLTGGWGGGGAGARIVEEVYEYPWPGWYPEPMGDWYTYYTPPETVPTAPRIPLEALMWRTTSQRRVRGGGGGGLEPYEPQLMSINPFIDIKFQDVSIDPGTYARFKRELAYTISRAICDAVQERRNL
ncbi:MAG: phage tail protein [Candidatus Bathyarchaeia archaeon]